MKVENSTDDFTTENDESLGTMTIAKTNLSLNLDDEDQQSIESIFNYGNSKGNRNHLEYLNNVKQSLRQNEGAFVEDKIELIDVISEVLSDKSVTPRKLALELLCEIIPNYGIQLDVDFGILFPQLLQNLLHVESIIKEISFQTLQLYFNNSSNKDVAVNYLIRYGINCNINILRTEVLIYLPQLITFETFEQIQLQKLFLSIMDLDDITDSNVNLPIILSLEHLKLCMGDLSFQAFYGTFEPDFLTKYFNCISKTDQQSSVKHNKVTNNDLAFGFLPVTVMDNIRQESSSQLRIEAIYKLAVSINTGDKHIMKSNCRDLLIYIQLLTDDPNFHIAAEAMKILHLLIIKLGKDIQVQLDLIMKILVKKLCDSKMVMRKVNLKIGLTLMKILSPTIFLPAIIPLLHHKSTRIREEVINIITGSLLLLPSSLFDLQSLPHVLAFTLLDNRKRVRLASLECFSILAQQLGSTKLSPLVSAIDVLERKNKIADGLLLAVQTRISRKMLPKISEDGLIQYALKIPINISNNNNNLKPDEAWIVAGSSCGSDTSRMNGKEDWVDNEKRLVSAGRSKLPWGNETTSNNERVKINSASVRSPLLPKRNSPEVDVDAVCEAWAEKSIANGYANQNKHLGNKSKQDENSYINLYRNRMKRMKEGGLRAEASITNTHTNDKLGQYAFEIPLSGQNRTSPLPTKPTLARSASRKHLDKTLDSNSISPQPKFELDDSSLAHTLPKMRGGLLRRLSRTDLADLPSRPTVCRSPSGSDPFKIHPRSLEETSNLVHMKKLSNSSPAVFNKKIPLSPMHTLPNGFSDTTAQRSPRTISPINRPLQDLSQDMAKTEPRVKHSVENLKLSKSAQEKVRRYKESRQRASFDLQYVNDTAKLLSDSLNNRLDGSYQTNGSFKNETTKTQKRPKDLIDIDYHPSKPKDLDLRLNEMSNSANDPYKNMHMSKNQRLPKENINKTEKEDSPRTMTSPLQKYDYNNNIGNENGPDSIFSSRNEKKHKAQPKIGTSPKVKKKVVNRTSPQAVAIPNEHPSVPQKSYLTMDVDKRVYNPAETIRTALEMLGGSSEEWESKCEAIIMLRQIVKNHADEITDMHTLVGAILNEVKNLRSQVSRSALSCISDIFLYTPRLIELELELILKAILPRAGDTNQFIRADTEGALNSLVENVNPAKVMPAIILTGVEHPNGNVRKVSAKAMADLGDKIGAAKFCQTRMSVAIAGKLAVDSQPETRYHGRRMLYLILDQPDLDALLERHLKPANLKPVRDVVETLKKKGLEPMSGSAALRRSTRNPTTSSRNGSTSSSTSKKSRRSEGGTTERISKSTKPKTSRSPTSRNNVFDSDDIQNPLAFLGQLDSGNWTERYEALDHFYDAVSEKPSIVIANLKKVFDKLYPRLCDSNSKVNLYALQTLNRCVPILEGHLSQVSIQMIENLKTPLASKTDSIYNAAAQCLSTITRYVDNSVLVQPIISAIQQGNARNKPDYILSLSDILEGVHKRKPSLITRQVLPLVWDLLSTSSSAAPCAGRPTLQHGISQLCIVLYECLGDDFVQDAQLKSARIAQRVEAILNF